MNFELPNWFASGYCERQGAADYYMRRNIVNRQIKIWALPLLAVSLAVPALADENGAEIYKSKCAMCHGADGEANTPAGKMLKAVPFSDPQIVRKSDADLIAATTNGKGKMPAFKDKLSDAQIKDVIEYIRTLEKK